MSLEKLITKNEYLPNVSASFYQVVDQYRLHCVRFGSGDKLMIAFHGFGDDAATFEVLEPSFGKYYTVVSVDLPFHGLSEWKAGEQFTPAQANDLVEELMNQHNVGKVSFAAFSIGGKIALKLFEMNPARTESLWLFAPDGLKNNMWYNLAVYPAFGRKMFRYLIDRPRLVIKFLRVLRWVKVFPESFTKFLEPHILDINMRERVWNTWLGIAGFEVLPSRLKNLLNQHRTPTHIFMGQFDPVIKPRIGRNFVKGLTAVHFEVIPKGHALLKNYLNGYIEQHLTK